MQKSKLSITLLVLILLAGPTAQAQYSENDSTYKKCFIGSTAFVLGNFAKVNKPDFAQLNLGYRITEKDVVSIELKTWKYAWPLGISPFSSDFETPAEEFPGYIREKGFALAYQRYLHKGLYAAVHVMNAWQTFADENGNKVDNGFQIFNTYRLGYHIKLFKNIFFIEPSIAVTHRPYFTTMPAGFTTQDNKWKTYLLGEPGLHFGFNF
jgi:hypothetical protein